MSRKLHILLLPSWFPVKHAPLNGIFNRELAQLLAESHQVSTLHLCFAHVEKVEIQTVAVSESATETIVYLPEKGNPLLRQFRYFIQFFKQANAIRKNYGRPDIIHVLVAWKMGLPAWLLKWRYRIPLVITEHYTGYLPADGSLKGYKKWWSYFLLKRANRVTAVSEGLVSVFRNHGVKKVECIPNRVHPLFFSRKIQNRKPGVPYTFIHISNFDDRQKQTFEICRTFAAFHEQHPQSELLLIVPGQKFEAYRKLSHISTAGIKQIEPLVNREDYIEILNAADMLISYSRFETFGLTVAEALCLGIPVIFTACGGPEHFVEPRMGIQVDQNDPETLYKAMELACNSHPFDAEEISAAARVIFQPQQILLGYSKLYSQLTDF